MGNATVFELFKIGIGPSSSHTMGPMLAARDFLSWIEAQGMAGNADRLSCELLGSLSATGKGHGTDLAVVVGLQGFRPEEATASDFDTARRDYDVERQIAVGAVVSVAFSPKRDIVFSKGKPHAYHPNTLIFRLLAKGKELAARTYFSVGGGFIKVKGETDGKNTEANPQPFPFGNAAELIALSDAHSRDIASIVLANETTAVGIEAVNDHLDLVWRTMQASVADGLEQTGHLPGPMRVRRRAGALLQKIVQDKARLANERSLETEWVSVWAIATNEMNASFGRIVTAPTNGAAGIIPAVLHYYDRFVPGASQEGIRRFLLTATAFGGLLKRNASISGADVGCQGEVGSAAAMAAAGLTACLGGTPRQIENAAEIALEHHLGMTCDPIGGLVQIPCIERNAIGAHKAIASAKLALLGDGTHYVSFDQAVNTMLQTGRDMKRKYKETSKGGLAVNVPLC